MTRIKWGAVAGIIFVIAFVAGMVMPSGPETGVDEPDDEQSAWFDKSSHQNTALAAAYLLTVAGVALLAFTALGLEGKLGGDGNTGRAALMRMSGAAAAIVIIVGGIALASSAASAKFDDQVVDPGAARLLLSLGYGCILVAGGLLSAFFIAMTSFRFQTEGGVPSWLPWLGYLAAVVLLAAIVLFPLVALPLWVLVTSVVLFAGSGETNRAADMRMGG